MIEMFIIILQETGLCFIQSTATTTSTKQLQHQNNSLTVND